ncbi:MAG: protein-L-isoaspartate(D-aspartate) O-methyltransferase [Sulfuricaulis sp.]|jgi:protein-L-isoaspartate(D-aspartate) O-methyltransferase|uniref:protein-L-isoaspartate(D-aspartate) O-methyltransferase n=1 Tax=Sulfuricaulis sp. TaxID=2003553 RepID=UPI0025DDD17F|nr:protein-L-isoaspartate(D-aspartate) O-methyltransferase [Sulfuricaulis sp.]MCR4346016.1 protein-L-isoaspartate(D-aspartate) O-methyltransferase [Sulfuricaulis sp.]
MDVHGIGMTSQRTRDRLIQRLREEGIRDERVLEAIRNVPRHVFVDEALASRAYEDTALPIGHGQTISQPYIVARMTQALIADGRPKKVLEVGTGSGYQTAVLAGLVDEIYSVERLEPLMKLARKRLREIGCRNVHIKLSDGSWGWKDHAPYDAIIVTAAPAEVPPSLLEQLAPGGRLVIPVGGPAMQELLLVQRTDKGLTQERLDLVNFVPLVRDSF